MADMLIFCVGSIVDADMIYACLQCSGTFFLGTIQLFLVGDFVILLLFTLRLDNGR